VLELRSIIDLVTMGLQIKSSKLRLIQFYFC